MRKIAFLILMTISLSALKAEASLLKRLTNHLKDISSVKGKFTQITIFPDGDRKVFKGTFYITKGKSRWDYQFPEKQIVITRKNKIFIFDPEEKSLQEGQMDTSIFTSGNFISDAETLKKNYRIKEGKNTLYLYPLKENNINSITIKVDDKLNISEITTDYKTGEKIILKFHDTKYNSRIDESLFSVERLTTNDNAR